MTDSPGERFYGSSKCNTQSNLAIFRGTSRRVCRVRSAEKKGGAGVGLCEPLVCPSLTLPCQTRARQTFFSIRDFFVCISD